MKKHFHSVLPVVCLLAICPCLYAQNTEDTIPQNPGQKDSFENFRKEIHSNFHLFRKNILDNYADFLEAAWKEFNSFRGEERYTIPKLPSIPKANPDHQSPTAPQPILPQMDAAPTQVPATPPSVCPPPVPAPLGVQTDTIHFYSLEMYIPQIALSKIDCRADATSTGFAKSWRHFEKNDVASLLIPYFHQYVESHQLNDWFACELIRTYADSRLAHSTPQSRIALAHYLLAHYGFDIRLAQTDSGAPALLIPFLQKVYARTYIIQNNTSYYVFMDTQSPVSANQIDTFTTYELPENADLGRPVDLVIHQDPIIPHNPCNYHLSYGNLTVTGEVNANLRPMLYRYPQTTFNSYAISCVSKEVRNDITTQLRDQLAGLPLLEATNALLQFVQHAFQYATDPEQHGFEKPYFFEELLLYPKCDCEDRSIFYSYLLWHVLGVENHFVDYPGHLCVAVHMEDPNLKGTCHRYKGKLFYISDPTYIGAVTGMCMPDYENESPQIEPSR